jgi:hypothetical protein
MLPRSNRYDEDSLDVTTRAVLYWMRFFAALRMTTSLSDALRAIYCARATPRDFARSKRSRFITLVHAPTKSCTNFWCASELP